ncbi:MAG: 2-C-methyl-D-erythritol 4-phosphate cytidylyltransferase [Planctomycetota bacterium]
MTKKTNRLKAKMHKVTFIIPAAGEGSRMKSALPKPFLDLAGKPVIFHTLEKISSCRNVVETILLLPPDRKTELEDKFGSTLKQLGVDRIAAGGSSRQESVLHGLQECSKDSNLIAVHDAVRPFAGHNLFSRLFAAAAAEGGALPVLPVTDTVKEVTDGIIKKTIPRDCLAVVQTPQVFQREIFETAYRTASSLGEEITDDASVIEKAGGRVAAVEGMRYNIKLTTPEDMHLADMLLKSELLEK